MASVRTQAPWMQHVPADFDEAADLAAEPLSHDECGDQCINLHATRPGTMTSSTLPMTMTLTTSRRRLTAR